MSDSSLDNAQLRYILRQISDQVDGPVQPRHVIAADSIDIETFVSQFGSLAQACLEAGCEYQVTERDPDVYAAGQSDAQSRQRLIDDLVRIAEVLERDPIESNLKSHGRGYDEETIREFGSWPAVVLEAGLDPGQLPEYISPEEFRSELKRLEKLIGAPPSRQFAAGHSDINIEAFDARFPSWEVALESASLNPDRINVPREIVTELEWLGRELDHRPDEAEINLYTELDTELISQGFKLDNRMSDPIENALDAGDVPSERELLPTGSLTRPPDANQEIPSHTDLLREVFTLRRRSDGPLDTVEKQRAAIKERGIINEKHYDAQFGSVPEAFEYASSLDARSYSSPRDERVGEVPQELLAEYAQELAEILDRRPLVDEVVTLTDAPLDSYLEDFESWDAVFDVEPIGGDRELVSAVIPSNADLLGDIERVGSSIERPPSPDEFRELGYFPVESVLRRFGSWPAALAAVGVEVTSDMPLEHLSPELTKATIQRAEHLHGQRFDHQAVLCDDLYRISVDLGRIPDQDDVDTFGVYPLASYEAVFGDLSTVVKDISHNSLSEDGLRHGDERSQLIADLEVVDATVNREVWPRDVAFFGRYTLPAYLAIFGTLEEAFNAAGIDSDHLPQPVTTWGEAWADVFPDAMSFIEAIRTQYEKTGEAPTMAAMRESGTSSQQCYEYYDTWDEALMLAGIPPEKRRARRGASRQELFESLRDLADELGRPPKTTDITKHSKYSLNAYYKHHESWQDVLEAAELTGTKHPIKVANETEQDSSEAESPANDDSEILDQIMADIEQIE